MLKKLMLILLLLAGILNAANLNLNKNIYNPNEPIRVHFFGMTAKNKDWIGIYPVNKNNDWENVKRWNWTGDTTAGDLVFKGLPVGKYEIRAFYNNSYHTEARKQFTVGGNNGGGAPTLITNKNTYNPNEQIVVRFSGMTSRHKDWLAIYRAGTSNEWKNVKDWSWTNNVTAGTITFKGLPAGNYEVRAFYNNSYHTEARKQFKVGGNNGGGAATVTTSKASYNHGETVTTSFNHMSGNNKDWIAVYKAGTNNEWKNVVQWAWTGGKKQGSKSFKNLPNGNYEVRVFFRNTFKVEARHAFTVKNVNQYLAIAKRMDNAINHVNNKVVYIVTGDSTRNNNYNKMIAYYTTQLKKANIEVFNNAQSGQRGERWKNNVGAISNISKALKHTEGNGENTILEYSFGINDFRHGTKAQIKGWLKEGLVAYMHAKPKALVLLVVPVASTNKNRVSTLAEIYHELSTELNLPLVDALIPTTPLVGNPTYYKDSIHPNARGSRIIVDYILGQIGSQLLKNKLGL